MSRDGRIWLNQKQMAELFAVSKMNVNHHIANILKEEEPDDSVVTYCFTTAADGKKYMANLALCTTRSELGTPNRIRTGVTRMRT